MFMKFNNLYDFILIQFFFNKNAININKRYPTNYSGNMFFKSFIKLYNLYTIRLTI